MCLRPGMAGGSGGPLCSSSRLAVPCSVAFIAQLLLQGTPLLLLQCCCNATVKCLIVLLFVLRCAVFCGVHSATSAASYTRLLIPLQQQCYHERLDCGPAATTHYNHVLYCGADVPLAVPCFVASTVPLLRLDKPKATTAAITMLQCSALMLFHLGCSVFFSLHAQAKDLASH